MLDMKKSVKLEMEKFLGLKQGEYSLAGAPSPVNTYSPA
jgi:hypothetical protein